MPLIQAKVARKCAAAWYGFGRAGPAQGRTGEANKGELCAAEWRTPRTFHFSKHL